MRMKSRSCRVSASHTCCAYAAASSAEHPREGAPPPREPEADREQSGAAGPSWGRAAGGGEDEGADLLRQALCIYSQPERSNLRVAAKFRRLALKYQRDAACCEAEARSAACCPGGVDMFVYVCVVVYVYVVAYVYVLRLRVRF